MHKEEHVKIGGLLKEAVFGFNDGLVSTFAVIAGLTGGNIINSTVLLAGLATLFAGAFSMGLGTYLGSKSEKELYESEKRREMYEMKHMPDLERQEIREIYAAKGFKGELLEKVVAQITSDEKVWLKTMMTEELGFADEPPRPGMNGVVMSAAFILGSIIPIMPYAIYKNVTQDVLGVSFMGLPYLFVFSFCLSVIGLLAAGAFKTRYTKRNIIISAFETLLVGSIAAGGSFGIGLLFP